VTGWRASRIGFSAASRAVVGIVLGCLALAPARALDNVDGLPVRLGDTYDQVKEAYHTPLEAEPVEGVPALRGATNLHLKTKGVWFFFDRSERIITIWLHAPFPGTVAGVKIGDTVSKMIKVLGKPIKTTVPVNDTQPRIYAYYLDDVTTALFETVGDSDVIEMILLQK